MRIKMKNRERKKGKEEDFFTLFLEENNGKKNTFSNRMN